MWVCRSQRTPSSVASPARGWRGARGRSRARCRRDRAGAVPRSPSARAYRYSASSRRTSSPALSRCELESSQVASCFEPGATVRWSETAMTRPRAPRYPPGRSRRPTESTVSESAPGRPGAQRPQPEVAVPVPVVHALAAVRLAELEPVVGDQAVRRQQVLGERRKERFEVGVRETGIEPVLAQLHGVAQGLGVPGAGGDQPGAVPRRGAVGERLFRVPSSARVGRAPAAPRSTSHQAAVAVAEVRREAAAVEVDAVDDPAVDQAERALEALQMERLVELEAVEDERDVPRLAAADVERGRVVGRGDAGQHFDDAAHVAAERRHEHGVGIGEGRAARACSSRTIDSLPGVTTISPRKVG